MPFPIPAPLIPVPPPLAVMLFLFFIANFMISTISFSDLGYEIKEGLILNQRRLNLEITFVSAIFFKNFFIRMKFHLIFCNY